MSAPHRTAHTLIVSDIHLGFATSKGKELLDFLSSYTYRRLIILGDLFDDREFSRLEHDHWSLLSYLREQSHDQKVEVILVRGNHDEKLIDSMSRLMGLPAVIEYTWKYNGQSFLATHGDQFDRFLSTGRMASFFSHFTFALISELDLKNKHFTRLIERLHGAWLRVSAIVAQGAAEHAQRMGANVVICGHTHVPLKKTFTIKGKSVQYFNTGAWTNVLPTFIEINEGEVKILSYVDAEVHEWEPK